MEPNGIAAFAVSLALGGLAFLVVARVLPGFRIRGGFGTATLVAFVYGLLKALLWKLLVVLTLPIVIVTLGLFIFVINAFLLWLTDRILDRLEVRGWATLLAAAGLLSVIDFLFHLLIGRGPPF
jgi:putative membrane protein